MSHGRSETSTPDIAGYTSQQFASTMGNYGREHIQLSQLERWASTKSDATFNAIAGATGGFMSGIVTCPLDVIKTKLQAQGAFRAKQMTEPGTTSARIYNGMLGTARVIWKEEGLRGMYRGLGPIILGYLPTWAVWFTVYGRCKDAFGHRSENQVLVNFWSSIIAGGCSTMVTNPIWVIKTRLMSQVSKKSTSTEGRPPWQYKSTFDAARKMYRTEGILSFYSGLTPALLGLTHVAVQFPAYEFLKKQFTGVEMGGIGSGEQKTHWMGILSASVLSKVLASSATYPHEVIRTRLQTQQRSLPTASNEYAAFRGGLEGSTQRPASLLGSNRSAPVPPFPQRYRGMIATFRTILHEEGWRAFYAGMGTNMMRAVPAATTTMLTYEFIVNQLRLVREEGRRKSSGSW